MVWLITALLLFAVAWFFTLMNRRAARENRHVDTGTAILDFARAFPDEPIRSLHMTQDGEAIFARLHDGRIGFMQAHGAHYACHLLGPEQVRAERTGSKLKAVFPGTAIPETSFNFQTHEDAEDVSNWLSAEPQFTAAQQPLPTDHG